MSRKANPIDNAPMESFFGILNGTTAVNTSYTYDNQNRLKTVLEDGVLQATYTYDINGNRASLTYSNGSSETYTYNKANWVTSVTNKTGSSTISSYIYTYYADGNQRTKTDHAGKVTTYLYDRVGRLKSESESSGTTISYQYDTFSNRTLMDVSGSQVYSMTYAYDANNRLLTETKTSTEPNKSKKKPPVIVQVSTNYSYDPNGNQIAKNSVAGNEISRYNGFNQLVVSMALQF